MAVQFGSAMPMSTKRQCLQDRVPFAATRLVQPLQLQEVEPSVYCRVSYSMFGFESDSNVQTLLICLFISAGELWVPLGKCSCFGFPRPSPTTGDRTSGRSRGLESGLKVSEKVGERNLITVTSYRATTCCGIVLRFGSSGRTYAQS